MGFVLENFDPIGRWREHYPIFEEDENGKSKTRDGQRVDASGVLPDGTEITNVIDLKMWMMENPEPFAVCLSEKLLTYATGRSLSYREQRLLEKIVAREAESGLRFQDLVLALVDSNIFRSR
jgi:hypothetical protein